LESEWDEKFPFHLLRIDGNAMEAVKRNFISNVSMGNIKQCCWADVLARRIFLSQ
jgi:hypothetical protein